MRNGLTNEMLRAIATSDEHYEILRALRPHALVVAPLRAGETTIGAILVARSTGPGFSREDADTIEEIARQAATALRNIWSYHAIDEASRVKDEFLTTLSHELRTPMTSILGWSQILRLDETASPTIRDGLESIERSARAQAQLIDDLLDLSRLQLRKLQFQVRPFALGEVVRAAVETIRPAAQARGINLVMDASEDVTIAGDPDRIQQVIWNLLSNAVKFSDRDGEVRVAVGVDETAARITVSDDGRGIDPAFLPHVFERFRQADSATTRRFGGLGLGLAIAKQLVEMHGGHVEARSAGVGKGATFVVTLPLSGSPVQDDAGREGTAPVSSDET
jgi:signal transduction histidine kinase